MPSLEQLKTLEALERYGSLYAAAKILRKSYTAVHYQIRNLEGKVGFELIDRDRYRSSLNNNGRAVLKAAKDLLDASLNLTKTCQSLKFGYEPSVRLVYDGVVNFAPIVRALNVVRRMNSTTQLIMSVSFHEEVEREFEAQAAEFMLVVTSPSNSLLPYQEMPPLKLLLVAARDHPLAKCRKKASISDLRHYPFVTVHGSSSRLGLSTHSFEQDSTLTVGDFFSKKMVIQRKLAYGWLPEYLIQDELKSGAIKCLKAEIPSEHIFVPRLFHRPSVTMGPASRQLLNAIVNSFKAKK